MNSGKLLTASFIVLSLMQLIGCATAVKQEPAPVEKPVYEAEGLAPPEEPEPESSQEPLQEPDIGDFKQTPQPPPANPATLALLDTASQYEKAGNFENAAAALERALRIDPENALLWHRLASIRLQQGQYQLAANLAAKSNSLTDDPELMLKNQRILEQAQLQL
jgi:tetratricopeptide (TPR) repeat protein